MTTLSVLSPEALFARAVAECNMGHPRLFIESYLWVMDIHGRLVPFHFTSNQDYYYRETFAKLKNIQSSMRVITVKARKAEWTSFAMACAFAFFYCVPGLDSLIIADSDKSTLPLFAMQDRFANNLPEEWGPVSKERWTRDYREMRHGGGAMSSTMTISSYKTEDFGRGRTPKLVILEEMGRFDRKAAAPLLESLENSMPPSAWFLGGGTPKGANTHHYLMYHEIKRGERAGVALLRLWYENPLNAYAPDDGQTLPADRKGPLVLTAEEEEIASRFLLDGVARDDHIRFRRARQQAAISFHLGDVENGRASFFAEYPEDDVNCWYSTENPTLPRERLMQLLRGGRAPIETARPAPGVSLAAWETPVYGVLYVAHLDPAGGGGANANSLAVLNVRTGVHALDLYGRGNVTNFTLEACRVAERYNVALFGIENNGVGVAAVEAALKIYGYPKLYRERDRNNPRLLMPTGLHMNEIMKGQIHDLCWRDLEHGTLTTFCRETIDAMRDYDPATDHWPDRVASLFGANWIRNERWGALTGGQSREGRERVVKPVYIGRW